MSLVKEREFESKWLLRRHGRFIQDIQIDLDDEEIVLGWGFNRGVKYAVGVSSRHALLKRTSNGQWKIKDLGSMDGLFINARKLVRHRYQHLEEFDIIGLGVEKAIHEEQFSFMLCQKPEVHSYDREFLVSPGSTIFVDSTDRNNNAQEKILNLEEDRSIPTNDCNKETSADFVNTLQKSQEIEDDDDILLQTNYKRKEIIIISDDMDCKDETIPVPRKRSKLTKRRPNVIYSEETDYKCDEMTMKNTFPKKTIEDCEGLLKSDCAGREGNVHYHDPNETKVEGNQHLIRSFQCDQKSEFNQNKPLINIHIFPPGGIASISDENAQLTHPSAPCDNRSSNFDINVTIHGEENFSSKANSVKISEEESFVKYKQNKTCNIKKEYVEASIEKEPTDISVLKRENKSNGMIGQNDDDVSVKDNQCNGEEMSLCKLVNGNKTDYSIDEEELRRRLVWSSTPDD